VVVTVTAASVLFAACGADPGRQTQGATASPVSLATPPSSVPVPTERNDNDVASSSVNPGDDEIQQRLAELQGVYDAQLVACADLWPTVREEVKAQTGDDGAGRRAADEARAACEDPILEALQQDVERILASLPTPEPPDCLGEAVELGEILAATPAAEPVQVYVTCDQQTGGPFGAWLLRGVPMGDAESPSTSDGPEAVFEAFAQLNNDGFSDVDVRAISATLDGNTLTLLISPSSPILDHLGAASQIDRFISEVAGNAFQFPEVQAVRITIDGDCAAFWGHTPFGRCMLLERTGLTRGTQ